MSIMRCEDCPRCEMFIREDRYIVLKRSDVAAALSNEDYANLISCMNKIDRYRTESLGKPILVCVVVEHDWPEYEPTWKAIEERRRHDHRTRN